MSTLAGIGAPADMGVARGRWPRPDAASLRQLYVEEGLTVAALAARFGVAAQTAHNWLVAAGVPRRVSPASARAEVSDVEVRRLYELEWALAQHGVAAEFERYSVADLAALAVAPPLSPSPRFAVRGLRSPELRGSSSHRNSCGSTRLTS